MPPPTLVVFDLDGTLIDSRTDLADAANATLAAFGCVPLTDADVAAMVGEGARVLVERVFGARGVAPPPDGALETFLERYDERLFAHTVPYPGVPSTLALLARRCRLAVLTNKPQRPAERLLEHFGLAPLFGRVIGGDARFPRKPDPAGLLFLMDDAGASAPGTLLVGDSWIDHETASRGGVRCCLVRYGFAFAQVPADRLRGDEVLVDRPGQLLDVVAHFAQGANAP